MHLSEGNLTKSAIHFEDFSIVNSCEHCYEDKNSDESDYNCVVDEQSDIERSDDEYGDCKENNEPSTQAAENTLEMKLWK